MMRARLFRLIERIRFRPVRVFCFHVVSDDFNPTTTWECDWISTSGFKQTVQQLLSSGYSFISITDAYNHLKNDSFRRKRYAVVTFDDGSFSITDIMPWLAERRIPVTLFVNPAYLAGEKTREKPMRLLSADELKALEEQYGTLITIGSHGYDHSNCSQMSYEELVENVSLAEKYLNRFPYKSSFFAYPCDKHTLETDRIIKNLGLIPVYCDGGLNYQGGDVIHRELPFK